MQNNSMNRMYDPSESLSTLTVVNLARIKKEKDLDYLEHLCAHIEKTKLNPIWY